MQKQYSGNGGVVSPVSKPAQQQKWQPVEIAARERMIIDRSYAAALAASQEAHQHVSQQQPQMISRTTSDNTGTFVIVQDQGIVGERPWITVGEHLRAQHMQQKVLEAQNQQNQNAMASSAAPTVEKVESDDGSKNASSNNNNNNNIETPNDEQHVEESEAASEEKHHVQEPAQMVERKTSTTTYKCTNLISRLPINAQPAAVMRCSSTVEQKPIYDAKTSAGVGSQAIACSSAPITPLESIITTQPLPSDRLNATFGTSRDTGERRSSDAIQTSVPTLGSGCILSSSRQPAPLTSEFQCPECMKTYSCRKNVKRHRMAVHKLSAEEVSRPMSAAQSVGSMGDSPPLPSLGQQVVNRMAVPRSEYKSDGHMMGSPQQIVQQMKYQDRVNNTWISPHQVQNSHTEGSWSRTREYVDDEESAETARIAAELKRSAEQEMAEIEGKKPRTELAEADTTFHEEAEPSSSQMHDSTRMHTLTSVTGQYHSNPASHSSISSWIEQKSVPVDVQHAPRTVPQSNPSTVRVNKRPPHVCIDCNRVLSSDYSLRRHRLTCVEARANGANQPVAPSGGSSTNTSALSEESLHLQDVMLGSACIGNDRNTDSMGMSDPMLSHVALSTPMHQQGVQFNRTPSLSGSGSSSAVDEWYERHSLRKTDDVPDSTTSQRLDRSTSPGILSTPPENSQPGCLQYTRKRANSGEVNLQTGHTARSQQHKHLCQVSVLLTERSLGVCVHKRKSLGCSLPSVSVTLTPCLFVML
ncbi:zinc finger, C2H2 type [Cooperia oncophora]